MELVRLYSNLQTGAVRLIQLRIDALPRRTHPDLLLVPQRVSRRLGTELLGRIMSEYVTGSPTTALARRYGIGKGTLLRLLREHGVTIRHQHRR